MKLSDFLDAQAVMADLRAEGKEDALRKMTAALYKAGRIGDPQEVFKALMQRESIDTTAVGSGVALPHTRVEGLERPVALLAVSRQGVDFNSKDGHPSYLFFLFLTPVDATEIHLQILSKAAAVFLNRALYHNLRRAKTPGAALRLVMQFEEASKEIYLPLSTEEIYQELSTGPEGLSNAEAAKRLERYGPNDIQEVRGSPLVFKFIENLYNTLAILLWAGGLMAFAAGMPQLGWAIFAVIVINAAFSFWQEYKAEKAMEALKRLLPRTSRVLRGNREETIDSGELVPGDIVLLEEGVAVSSDARLIEAFGMRVDSSALTGESAPVNKIAEPVPDGREFLWTEIPNLIFAGSIVTSGIGKAVVIATGMRTEIGRIATLTQEMGAGLSPLQRELVKATRTIAALAIGMGVLFFFLGTFITHMSASSAFIFTIGMIVGNVPEGLLPTVSLSLAMAVQKMAKRNIIVKRLSSVETLGSTDVICTDKTGTLTTNTMTVVKVWINGKTLDVSGAGYALAGRFYHDGLSLSSEEMRKEGLPALFDVAVLCNNACLTQPGGPGSECEVTGDPTESALLVMAAKGGVAIDARKRLYPRVGTLPFDSVRKRMASINTVEGAAHSSVKGAPKEILERSSSVLLDGRAEPLTDELRERISKEIDSMAADGLRVLALAFRRFETGGYTSEAAEEGLTLVGLTAMMDPPRAEVPDAIASCHQAGIRVVMITGDYGLTALAIAKKVGLARDGEPRVVAGAELSGMSDEELKKALSGTVIFSRVSPEHKMRIVSVLKEMGKTVAVTGDGVNDAPALKKADIGIAMGIRGSDVAKESAAMVLTDDNFASIVEAVREGRTVYENIRKFIVYIMTHNFAEVVPFVAYILFNIPLPLTVMQILAIDLGSDILPALALGAEPPEPGIMKRPPRARSARLLDAKLLLRAYGFLGPIEALFCMAGFFFVYYANGWVPGVPMEQFPGLYAKATTMTFASIVATQIGNVFACRTGLESVFKAGLFSNRMVLFGIAAELALLVFLIYTPPLRSVFGLAPLGLRDWGLLSVFPLLIFFASELRKWSFRHI